MGLFTGLAIGAAAAGGLLAGRKAAGNKKQQLAADATSTTTAPGPNAGMGDTPAPPIINPAADQAAAVAAGQRQRKKAALGALTTRSLPKPGTINAKLGTPKTLTGY